MLRHFLAIGLSAIFISDASIAPVQSQTVGSPQGSPKWLRHVIHEGEQAMTAVAGDFTGDGLPDVISDVGDKTQLFVAPNWDEVTLDQHSGSKRYIHSECFDIDGDGDLDYVGARYNPGQIIWLEQPAKGSTQRWQKRLIDDTVHGIHGLIKGDVDGDGRFDLLATSAQPKPPYPESLAWFRVPQNPRSSDRWTPHIFANQDAPGLTHYIGVGDVNGDGRLDAATGAKGGPQSTSQGAWFAWWEASALPETAWTKHLISDSEPGATNIHPADVNADGTMDFVASRGHGKGVVWFKGPTWQRYDIDAEIQEPHCLVVVDMDADGDLDAATCAFGSKQAAWYENDGKGRFQKHVVGENQESYDIRAIDMDRDGDLDLLIAGRGSNNIVWYENTK